MILVATDFSTGADDALDRLVRLPLGVGAGIDLLHVLPDESDLASAKQVDAAVTSRLQDMRESIARRLDVAGTKNSTIYVSTARGKPVVEIVRSARHGRADLIVVGRHGERKFRDLLIGSTAERVIRKGDVPVLVVGEAPRRAYERVLVAVDMSDSSRLALELALQIAEPSASDITVVHAISLPSSVYLSEASLLPQIERVRAQEEIRVREELNELLGEVGGPERSWNVTVREGDPRHVILDEARARRADLIALGTKGRTGLPHVLIGSVAEGVLRAARCDVLVARAPRASLNLA